MDVKINKEISELGIGTLITRRFSMTVEKPTNGGNVFILDDNNYCNDDYTYPTVIYKSLLICDNLAIGEKEYIYEDTKLIKTNDDIIEISNPKSCKIKYELYDFKPKTYNNSLTFGSATINRSNSINEDQLTEIVKKCLEQDSRNLNK